MKNKKFAFISRHSPTDEQINLAKDQGISLIYVGDTDAFSVSNKFLHEKGEFDGAVVVHPAMALRLCSTFLIGVFKNGMRTSEGSQPKFYAESFHIYDILTDECLF